MVRGRRARMRESSPRYGWAGRGRLPVPRGHPHWRRPEDRINVRLGGPSEDQGVEIPVTPHGSDTARFELGPVEQVNDEMVRVGCKWTDLDSEGQKRADEMTWSVLKEAEGWRIAGLAATVFDGEPPLLLRFP